MRLKEGEMLMHVGSPLLILPHSSHRFFSPATFSLLSRIFSVNQKGVKKGVKSAVDLSLAAYVVHWGWGANLLKLR